MPTPVSRTKEELLEIGDDPGEEFGTYDLLRDTIESMFGQFQRKEDYPAPRALTSFDDQAGFGNTAQKGAANTRALINWVSSGEHLYIDPDDDNLGFWVDHFPRPKRSIFGHSHTKSRLNAAVGFTPVSDTFLDLHEPLARSVFQDFSLLCGQKAAFCVGNDQEASATPTSANVLRRLNINGGSDYALGFNGDDAFLGGPGVGMRVEDCIIKPGVSTAGWIKIQKASDDMVFDHLRFSMPGGKMDNPLIHVDGTIVNIAFKHFFISTLDDYDSGSSSDAIFKVKSGSKAITWDGGYIELTPSGKTHTKLRYFADIESGNASLRDVWMQNQGSIIFPANSAFIKHRSGNVQVHNCISQIENMDHIVGLESGATSTGDAELHFSGNSMGANTGVVNGFNNLDSSGEKPLHLFGTHRGVSYDHDVSHDGSVVILTPADTVSLINTDSPYTVTREKLVLCDATSGAITVNLPAASSGVITTVKKTDSSGNAITIDGSGSETIDGTTTKVITTQYASLTMSPQGGAYHIV